MENDNTEVKGSTPEKLSCDSPDDRSVVEQWQNQHFYRTGDQLIPVAEEAESDLGSDEENELVKQIRLEVADQMRGQMKDELAVYEEHLEHAVGESEEPTEDDLRIKEGWIQIRKLDKILRRRLRREFEVKRDRIELQRKLRDELEQLEGQGATKLKEVAVNTERFLALAPPPPKPDDEELEDVETERESVTPIFQTQISGRDFEGKRVGSSLSDDRLTSRPTSQAKTTSRRARSVDDLASSEFKSATLDVSSEGNSSSVFSTQRRRGRNFIKRNIELAANAGELILETAEEKERITRLLENIDQDEDIETPTETPSNSSAALVSLAGEGFKPDCMSQQSLTDIDDKLKCLTPSCSSSLTSFSRSSLTSDMLFQRLPPLGPLLEEGYRGEKVLGELKVARNEKQRLENIDSRLTDIKSSVDEELGTPSLSEHQMELLVDECSRCLTEANATASLTEVQLKQLLEESVLTPSQSQMLEGDAGGEDIDDDGQLEDY